MTAGQALEQMERLRPGCKVSQYTRMQWLREEDARLRENLFRQSSTHLFDGVGADRMWDEGLQDEDVLLAPEPFDGLYVHYLCARADSALGETNRCAGEQAQYNAMVAQLAVWMRQNFVPRRKTRWRW